MKRPSLILPCVLVVAGLLALLSVLSSWLLPDERKHDRNAVTRGAAQSLLQSDAPPPVAQSAVSGASQ
ncbi:hypothetical protein [Pantoea sp. 1.19]|uniref:hypothetical protein n=1 Tax=Pantoea sp. 1.19 TaxID=1925589 RepID=UPI000948B6B7|nr:hypothetical protein [Pantoea sp. 1.19]